MHLIGGWARPGCRPRPAVTGPGCISAQSRRDSGMRARPRPRVPQRPRVSIRVAQAGRPSPGVRYGDSAQQTAPVYAPHVRMPPGSGPAASPCAVQTCVFQLRPLGPRRGRSRAAPRAGPRLGHGSVAAAHGARARPGRRGPSPGDPAAAAPASDGAAAGGRRPRSAAPRPRSESAASAGVAEARRPDAPPPRLLGPTHATCSSTVVRARKRGPTQARPIRGPRPRPHPRRAGGQGGRRARLTARPAGWAGPCGARTPWPAGSRCSPGASAAAQAPRPAPAAWAAPAGAAGRGHGPAAREARGAARGRPGRSGHSPAYATAPRKAPGLPGGEGGRGWTRMERQGRGGRAPAAPCAACVSSSPPARRSRACIAPRRPRQVRASPPPSRSAAGADLRRLSAATE